MRLQILAARAGLTALVVALGLAGAAVAGVRLGAITFATGMEVMAGATLLGLGGFLGGAVWFWQAARRNAGDARRCGLAALAGAALFLYFPLTSFYYGLALPPITDVSTDTDAPPAFVTLAGLRTAGMNPLAFDGQSTISYQGEARTIAYVLHDMKNGELTRPSPRFFPRSLAPVKTLFWRSFETVKKLDWHIVAYDEATGRIEATTRSFWFGRDFDIVLNVRPAGAGARVAVRVQDRADPRDHGYAIRLLQQFLAANP